LSSAATLPIPASSGKAAPTLSHGASARSIGNSYIAGEGVCQDGETSDRCFLRTDVRDRLFTGVVGRLGLMATMVSSAVNKLRVDELIKQPEDLDPLTSFLVDVATSYLGTLAGKAVKLLRGAPAKTLLAIGVGRVGIEDEDKAKDADSGVVALAIKGAVSISKKGASALANEDTKAEHDVDKVVAVNYLTTMEEGTIEAIKNMDKEVFGNLDDANRILLYLTLDQLKASEVHAEIAGSLARYRASPASKIGRTQTSRHMEKTPEGSDIPGALKHQHAERKDKKIDNVNDLRDTKLVMVRTTSDAPPRLYYYKRDYDGAVAEMPGGDSVMNTKSAKAQDQLDAVSKDDDFVQYKEVEPEFYDLAIANNMQAWGVPYATRIFTDEFAPLTKPKKVIPPSLDNAGQDLVAPVITNAIGGAHSPMMRRTD
jgi:hypothetical protein